jgi:hypothetical protein
VLGDAYADGESGAAWLCLDVLFSKAVKEWQGRHEDKLE